MKVANVEVKQVDMPESMLRAMAKQAEAEREKRSKIIHAEGEFSAAQRLVDAAHLLATEPVSVQLRYLQTLTEIGVEKNTTVVFPVPVDFFSGIQKMLPVGDAAAGTGKTLTSSSEDCMAKSEDTEITLGTGKMLALFFGLVVLCAIFFGMGFSLGKSTAKPLMADSTPTTSVSNGQRPTAIKPATATSNDTAFYKPATQKNSDAAPAPSPASSEAAQPAPAAADTKAPDPMAPVPTNGYFVQVAAVTKQEDAQALVEA